MATLAAFPEPMNVEQFLAFYDTRPDGEKWELLDGELFMNATPVNRHQKIVGNLIFALGLARRQSGGQWDALPGIGVRLSDVSTVEPDVMIRPLDDLRSHICDDIIVAFEVLSPYTRKNDLGFKRANYTALPRLTHYVVISPEQPEVRVFARHAGWIEEVLNKMDASIQFEGLDVALPLRDIYADMTAWFKISN